MTEQGNDTHKKKEMTKEIKTQLRTTHRKKDSKTERHIERKTYRKTEQIKNEKHKKGGKHNRTTDTYKDQTNQIPQDEHTIYTTTTTIQI